MKRALNMMTWLTVLAILLFAAQAVGWIDPP